MKVKTLKEMIKMLPDDSVVYVASDTEGNSFAELSEDLSATGNAGAVVLYPLHKMVDIQFDYCAPCATDQVVVDGVCSVCGQDVDVDLE